MQINANVPDKILSLVLDVAQCSFVRITEFKKNERARYQYGDASQAVLLDDSRPIESIRADSNTIESIGILADSSISIGQYQFNISIVDTRHAHIECLVTFDHSAADNKRESGRLLLSSAARVEIELIHNTKLPDFFTHLHQYHNANIVSESHERTGVQDIEWPCVLLLKTLSVSVESLQLFEHYTQINSDSLTKLRSRTALQRGIDEQIIHSSMALCMIHCTDFQHVNRKFGQVKGDTVLQEIASTIEQYTRIDDISGRFGGALFGVAVLAENLDDGFTLATKLQVALQNKTYLKNALRLNFNVGLAYVSQEEDQLDNTSTSSLLISRAEQALKVAQNSNKPSIVQWEPDKFRLDEQEFNYLGGIFTPDNVTNYRNMLLLWDISSIIADEHTFERLLKSVIERLAFTFEFAFAGIVSSATLGEHDSLAHEYSFELKNATDIVGIKWNTHPYRLLVESTAKLAIESSQHTEHQKDNINALFIPLGNDTGECFFIIGEKTLLDLTHDTVMLFVGFARQLGKAFKRSQLEDQLNKNLEQQNAKLSQELLELKAGIKSSTLVYRSAKMQKIVEQTQRAAQTDATVLITGESGTGKEKLINAIHVLSPRSKQALVIVDCSSIPETLIEAELFGHVKGAFTGAQSDSKGKIQAADGGILILDEIGELPLSMQPKLLRFVQEKHYTPVGGNKALKVDVKIVAVTNRDLPFEVSQGKFRKDLYYRLNVVSLHNPPLRERLEDIDLLCQHFLSKFSRQFEMDKKRISQSTVDMMRQYSWPGNIRELENMLMQASLLTTNDEIEFDDLNIELAPAQNLTDLHSQAHNPVNNTMQTHIDEPTSTSAPQDDSQNAQTGSLALNSASWCLEFSETLERILSDVDRRTIMNLSLGNVIESLLLHMAHKEHRSHAKTAVALELPISTARRRLQKPLPNLTVLNDNRHWQYITRLFALIVSNEIVLPTPIELIRDLTAQCILKQHSTNMALASQLMGVSEPTMYKMRKQLQHHKSLLLTSTANSTATP